MQRLKCHKFNRTTDGLTHEFRPRISQECWFQSVLPLGHVCVLQWGGSALRGDVGHQAVVRMEPPAEAMEYI